MKNIVITGSSRGVGLHMAKEFLKAGCRVVVSGRSNTLTGESVNVLAEFEKKYMYIPCDVKNKKDVEALWTLSAEYLGRIDVWINNAGMNAPHKYVYETSTEYTDVLLDTNIRGLIYGSQVAAKNMVAQKTGAIWNMEGLGSNGSIQKKTILYGTSKRALRYFTMGLAKELEGSGVFAGRLSPGMMLTDFIMKSPDGEEAAIKESKAFQKVFNLLADKPETVASFLVPRMLANSKNNALIEWLTPSKIFWRFLTAPFSKRKLVDFQ
jgi:short-subunit dehydrogenase